MASDKHFKATRIVSYVCSFTSLVGNMSKSRLKSTQPSLSLFFFRCLWRVSFVCRTSIVSCVDMFQVFFMIFFMNTDVILHSASHAYIKCTWFVVLLMYSYVHRIFFKGRFTFSSHPLRKRYVCERSDCIFISLTSFCSFDSLARHYYDKI